MVLKYNVFIFVLLGRPPQEVTCTYDEVGGPPRFGPSEPTAVVDMFSMPPREDRTVDVSDNSATRRLKSFTRRMLKNVDSSLICKPPNQPPAKPVPSPWNRRLAVQSLSRVPASKRGEVLIIQRMCYTSGPSAPSVLELEAFDKIFDDNLIASNVEALDMLFPDGGKDVSRQPRRRKATSKVAPLHWFWLFFMYVILKFEVFC